MNKITLAASIASIVLLAGCSGGGAEAPAGGSTEGAAPAAPAATAATESAPAETQAAADSDYVVTIDGATTAKDYEGKPAMIVDFTFTNNSDDAQMFMVAVSPKAFQNGVELELAVVTDGYDSAGSTKEIKPGATTQVQMAYLLADESEVSVEVEETFSFSNELIAEKKFPVQ